MIVMQLELAPVLPTPVWSTETIRPVPPREELSKLTQALSIVARAEVLRGDRIAPENYFQHAEHYLRSMQENAN